METLAGLGRVAGNVKLYSRLLVDMAQHHGVTLEALQASLEEGQVRALESQAHALKGAAANLGVTGVQRYAEQLERLAREENLPAARECLISLVQAMTSVSTGILEGIGDFSPPASSACPDQLASQLDRLQGHLEQQEGQALECLEEALPSLRARAPASPLSDLVRCTESFDFESALEHLRLLRRELGQVG